MSKFISFIRFLWLMFVGLVTITTAFAMFDRGYIDLLAFIAILNSGLFVFRFMKNIEEGARR